MASQLTTHSTYPTILTAGAHHGEGGAAMTAAQSKQGRKKRQGTDVAKVVADALVQGKRKPEIIAVLVSRGLSDDEARRWVSRVIP
jgi:hypothetical protein